MSIKTVGTHLCALAITTMSAAVLAAQTDLFEDGNSEFAYDSSQPWVVRGRQVQVNLGTIGRATEGSLLGLNLFGDARFEGRVKKITRLGAQRWVVQGELVGHPGAGFTLARNQGVLVGTVNAGDQGHFKLRHAPSGHQLVEIDHGSFPPCGTTHEQEVDAPADGTGGDVRPEGSSNAEPDPATMDVMVVYTPNARNAVGGTTAMEALIDLAVAETNTAYGNSGIASRIRLVHQYEVNYNSSGDFGTDLDRLTSTSDGHMDAVHQVRDRYGADMVSLWINDTDYCGLAWLMTTLSSGFASNAFSVVYHGCATGYYSFGHEMGHNQGCAHDRANAGSAVSSYSYGWRFWGQNGTQYRSVMAYAPGTRIDHFSSPLVSFQGTATGTPTDDNARTIDEVADTVAAFRAATVSPCPAEATVAERLDGADWLDLLYAVREQVLPNLSGGEGVVAAYYEFAPEVGSRLLSDRRLRARAMVLLKRLRPSLEHAVAAGDLQLTANQRRAVAAFARELQAGASEALDAELDRFLMRLQSREW